LCSVWRGGAPPGDASNKVIDAAFNGAGSGLVSDGLVLKFQEINHARYSIGKQWWDLVLDELRADGRLS
jgi:hypothetical protein